MNSWTENIFNERAIDILLNSKLQDNPSSICETVLHIAGCLKSLASDHDSPKYPQIFPKNLSFEHFA